MFIAFAPAECAADAKATGVTKERTPHMINWEELKHIHVIRKLEGILAQWFHTDIFFVDERGQVRNFDLLDRHKEFKNPLAAALMPKEEGRAAIMKCIAEANEKVYKGEHAHVTVAGPVGCETVLVSRIAVDNEFLGSVFAYSYADKAVADKGK